MANLWAPRVNFRHYHKFHEGVLYAMHHAAAVCCIGYRITSQ